jgi:hypothetical protein
LEELETRDLLAVGPMQGVYALGIPDYAIPKDVLGNPYVDGVVIRASWNKVETGDGVFDWSYLSGQVAAAVAAGKQVALRITPGVNTPSWVYSAGAQAFTYTEGGKSLRIPVPWDSVNLAKWEGFILAMGKQFSGQVGLAEVSMTGLNSDTGETFLPDTHADTLRWQSIGYTRVEVESAWKSIATTWAQAFPQQQLGLIMVPGGFPTIDNYGNTFSNAQGTDLQVTNDLIQYGISTYGSQFLVQNNGLSDLWISPQVTAVANQVTTGYEMFWWVTGDSGYKMNGGTPTGIVSELQHAVNPGLTGGAKFLEFYTVDIENPNLQKILSSTQLDLTAVVQIGPAGPTSDATPTFSWQPVTQADHYDVWVNDLTTHKGQVLRNQDVTGTSWTAATPLTQSDSYQWWVQAISSSGFTTTWGIGQQFSVTVLGTPVLGDPSGTITNTTPTFTWSAVDQADHYDLWVNDLTTGQGQVVRNQDVVGTSWTDTTPLVQGDTYVWWLRAIGSSDQGRMSAWSLPQQFAIPPLATPGVSGPSGTSNSLLPTFSWAAVDQADHYDIWVDDLTTGQSQVLRNQNVSGTSWTPSTPLVQGHQYNWWVRAVSSSGGRSAWTTIQTFTVVPLDTPILIGPVGATTGTAPSFSWNTVSQADHYDIWVNDVTTGQGHVFRDQNVSSTSWTPPTDLTQGDTYLWWVQAVSSDGNTSLWSSGMTFTVT